MQYMKGSHRIHNPKQSLAAETELAQSAQTETTTEFEQKPTDFTNPTKVSSNTNKSSNNFQVQLKIKNRRKVSFGEEWKALLVTSTIFLLMVGCYGLDSIIIIGDPIVFG